MKIIKIYGIVNSINDKTITIAKYNIKDKTSTDIIRVKYTKNLPLNIKNEKVVVWVFEKKYDFISTYPHNEGQRIRGCNLHMVKIEKNGDW
jgi:hypothetical protein